MIINYKVNDQNLKVIIQRKIFDNLLKDLKSLNSDKKILFIYDKRIDQKIIKNFALNLKTSGCSVFFLELTGNKINKTEKTLFRIIDFLIEKKFTKNSVILSCSGGVIGDIASLASNGSDKQPELRMENRRGYAHNGWKDHSVNIKVV